MILKKPLPTIARCACKHGTPSLYEAQCDHNFVRCSCGWSGPWKVSKRAAILAWNRVMLASELAALLLIKFRKDICEQIRAKMRDWRAGSLQTRWTMLYKLLGRIEEGR